MNTTSALGIMIVLCAASLGFAQQSGGEQTETDESTITMGDVPFNVRTAAMTVASAEGLEIQEVNTEVERDGGLNYEFGGEGFEIDITADGSLDEIERTG